MKTLAPPWPGLDVIKRKVPAQAGVSFCHVSRPGCGLRSSALLGAMLHNEQPPSSKLFFMDTSAWSLSAVGATKYAFPVGVRLDSLAHFPGCKLQPKAKETRM